MSPFTTALKYINIRQISKLNFKVFLLDPSHVFHPIPSELINCAGYRHSHGLIPRSTSVRFRVRHLLQSTLQCQNKSCINVTFSSLPPLTDSPQVQCIRAYVAQQPDELSLEKADVLLVTQQSTDGQYLVGLRCF